MSEFKTTITTIKEVLEHPNAERLSIYKVYGWSVVGQKGKYNVGDKVVYFCIGSILSSKVEALLFPPDSKVKLNKSRIKQIKLRGAVSEGMIADPALLGVENYPIESNVADILNITKYEPPTPDFQENKSGVKLRNRPKDNPYFHKYGGLDNFKYYPDLFEEGEEVSVTEKIHGSSIKVGLVPYHADTLLKKLLKVLRLAPTHEYVYGSNNVQLQNRVQWWNIFNKYKGFYGSDIYGQTLKKYKIREKLNPGEVLYGEIYGEGIQKDYNYGCSQGEHKLVWFDLKIQTETSSDFVDVDVFHQYCKDRGLDRVPEIYRGPFNKDLVKNLTLGDSVLCPEQKVREGVVIKPLKNTVCYMGRKVLKLISEQYLEKDQTEFH